jgi:hypothetical protein
MYDAGLAEVRKLQMRAVGCQADCEEKSSSSQKPSESDLFTRLSDLFNVLCSDRGVEGTINIDGIGRFEIKLTKPEHGANSSFVTVAVDTATQTDFDVDADFTNSSAMTQTSLQENDERNTQSEDVQTDGDLEAVNLMNDLLVSVGVQYDYEADVGGQEVFQTNGFADNSVVYRENLLQGDLGSDFSDNAALPTQEAEANRSASKSRISDPDATEIVDSERMFDGSKVTQTGKSGDTSFLNDVSAIIPESDPESNDAY